MAICEDHNRFRDIVKGKVKEEFRKYVSQGEMIGKRENEFVKIPLPSIDLPTFRYGPKQQGGVGQGQDGRDVVTFSLPDGAMIRFCGGPSALATTRNTRSIR